MGESSEKFFLLCSRLSLPPHLYTLSEVVRQVRLPSAAPVSFPPWPPDLRLERQGCLYKATLWQQQMPIRAASQSFATHSYS